MEVVETTCLLFQKTSQRFYYFGEIEKTILLFWVGRDYEFTENGGVVIWNPDTAITFLYRKCFDFSGCSGNHLPTGRSDSSDTNCSSYSKPDPVFATPFDNCADVSGLG